MLLADELVERLRPHPRGERLVRGGHPRLPARRLVAGVEELVCHGAGSTLSCVPEPAQLERRTTELLQRLIRFNTVNPPGNEQAAQEFLRDTLAAAGFECELLSAVEGRPNLIARLRGRATARRSASAGTSTRCSPTRATGRSTRGRAS